MDHYNYEIAVCSLIFFSLTLVFYFSKRQFPSAQNKLFSIALVMGFFDIALDIASSIIIENVSRLPLALVYGVNTLFYSLQVIFPALMFLYALASVNPEKQGRRLRAMLLLPEAIMLALTLSNPFTHCVFYVKEGLYIRTALFPVLYILGAFYTLLTFITVIIYRKRMSSAYFWALYFFVFLSAASLGISFKYPEYLLSSIAIAIAMNIMYQVMQKPEDMLDRLTETFNRGAMQIYLKACIEGSRKYRLIMVEINGIRRTNNLFGYTMGDAVLKETAKFMQSISDDWTFRVISNQFLIVSTGEETGEYFIKKISERFSEPWDINNISMHLTPTATCLEQTEDITSPEEALRILESLLTATPPGELRIADSKSLEAVNRRAFIEGELPPALEAGKLKVYFQPIYSLKEGRFTRMEALIRFPHETMGFIPPDEFIPIAEKNGLILAIDEYVMRRVCKFIAEYDPIKTLGIDIIEINLSAVEFVQSELTQRIAGILREYGTDPSRVIFEITETAATADYERLSANMDSLLRHDFKFALDDYGTGYANISQISRLSFSAVKIDRSVLYSESETPQQAILFRHTVKMLQDMGFEIVVEGVETKGHSELLMQMGVDYAQGYYYARPMPIEDLADFLKDNKK